MLILKTICERDNWKLQVSRTGLYCTLHWGQIWLMGRNSVFYISSANLTTLWAIISVTSSLKPKYEWLCCRNSCESRGERDLKSSYANIHFQVLVRVCWKPFNQSTDLFSSLLTTKTRFPQTWLRATLIFRAEDGVKCLRSWLSSPMSLPAVGWCEPCWSHIWSGSQCPESWFLFYLWPRILLSWDQLSGIFSTVLPLIHFVFMDLYVFICLKLSIAILRELRGAIRSTHGWVHLLFCKFIWG